MKPAPVTTFSVSEAPPSAEEAFAVTSVAGTRIARATHVTMLAFAISLLALALIALGIFLTARQQAESVPVATLRAIGPVSPELQLPDALPLLAQSPVSGPVIETQRSEGSFWVATRLSEEDVRSTAIFDFPSRHMVDFEIWILDGSGSVRLHTAGNRTAHDKTIVRTSDSGIAVTLPRLERGPLDVVANIRSVGPTKITARLWKEQHFQEHMRAYERIGGILIGGLTLFGLFSAIVAIRTQQSVYILFSGWLITTLGVAALSTGHMHTWGGEFLPESIQILPRKAFIAACAIYTSALFRALFYRELCQLRLNWPVDITLFLCIGLSALSIILPMHRFIPIMWLTIGSGAFILIWCLAKIIGNGSVSAKWFASSWIATFAGSLAEIAFAMGILPELPPGVNNVGGAVMAALLMGAALSEQMKVDKQRRQDAEQKAVAALASYRDMYHRNAMPMCRVSKDGLVVNFNPAFFQLARSCGYQGQDLAWHPIEDALGTSLTPTLFQHAARQPEAFDLEWEFVDRTDTKRCLAISGNREGDFLEVAAQDITDRKSAESTLRHLAEHDYLTGLPNRRALENRLAEWKTHESAHSNLTITYLDLDRFKLINDLFGHTAGDEVLKEVARRIAGAIQPDAIACRIGGDEFIIAHPHSAYEEAIEDARKLVAAIADANYSIQGGTKAVNVACSAGVVTAELTMPLRDVIATADAACAEAKHGGRQHVIGYHHTSHQIRGKLAEMRILEDFKERFPKDRLKLFLQPIASAKLSGPLCAESLVRMVDSDGRLMHPTQFVGLAERNGLMSSIDAWVVEQAVAWLDSDRDPAAQLAWLSVNFSATSLNDENFIARICELLKAHPKATSQLCIEVTESSALIDLNYSKQVLERFLSLGARVALDDFGAGYTSFKYLAQLPANLLKIDGEFIKEILTKPENRAIAKTIVGLARDLKMETVAEWVETPELLNAVLPMDVDYIQGYLVSRPIPASSFNSQAPIIHGEFRKILAKCADSLAPSAQTNRVVTLDAARF